MLGRWARAARGCGPQLHLAAAGVEYHGVVDVEMPAHGLGVHRA